MIEFPHRAALAVGAALILSGCASVTSGTTQQIRAATTPVSGAACTLTNSRGQWSVVSPGSVEVGKSATVLKIVCVKSGYQDGVAYLTPGVPTVAQVGMLLPYVGILSAAVDGTTGAANQYPSSADISMKESVPAASTQSTGETQSPSVVQAH